MSTPTSITATEVEVSALPAEPDDVALAVNGHPDGRAEGPAGDLAGGERPGRQRQHQGVDIA
jgi:hypothetical protein